MSKATKTRRGLFGVLPIIALMFGYQEVFMSQATANGGVKNVVLVHGGFVDGSGWQGVYDTLKKDGYTVSIVQNPTISLADDVAVTKRDPGRAGRSGDSRRPFVRWRRHHRGRERSEGRGPRLHRGVCAGHGRIHRLVAQEPARRDSDSGVAARSPGASDPAAAGRLSVSRPDEVSSVVRGGCECRRGGLHGGLAGAVGYRCA